MKIIFSLLLLIFLSFFFHSCNQSDEKWMVLFDGESLDSWRGIGRQSVPKGHWIIEDACIRKLESGRVPLQSDGQPLKGGDLMTKETFKDFELIFEWKISQGGNSGIKYNVSEEMSMAFSSNNAALGFEYQVLDDNGHLDRFKPSHQAASLYDLIVANDKNLSPVGEFNSGRIIFKGNHGEHWLNGKKVLEYDLDTAVFDSLFRVSKYHDNPEFPKKRKGHIVLQDHTDDVWYRNIKIRSLKSFD